MLFAMIWLHIKFVTRHNMSVNEVFKSELRKLIKETL